MNTMPDFMEIVVKRGAVATPAKIAEVNVLSLDTAMKEIYQVSLDAYKEHFRARIPIVYALFNEMGGQYILWRPGHEAEIAPPAPALYALCKSVAHSSLAIYSAVAPYLETPQDQSWKASVEVFLTRMKTARATNVDLDIPDEIKQRFEKVYQIEIDFMENLLAGGEISLDAFEGFAAQLRPLIAENIATASEVQVWHWSGVLKEWKERMGAEWEKMYAVTNTLYVTRRNNIHYTILANHMGRAAMNQRLLLIEGTSFEAPIDQLFDVLARIVADRAVGEVFFKYGMVMDAELIWEGAREAIGATGSEEAPAHLPPISPLISNEWPWITQAGEGPSGLVDLGIYTPKGQCPMRAV